MSDNAIDQINRFVIVIAAMMIAFAALAVVLLAWGAPGGSIDKIADVASFLERHNDRETKIIITLGASVAVLLMLTVIVLEIAPPADQRMRVRNLKSGEAAITTSEIARLIDAEARAIAEVATCTSAVIRRGTRVEVVLTLHVNAGADLSQTADAACRAAQSLVEERLGIELAARPRARLHYRELRLGQEGPAAPASGWERPTHVPPAPVEEDRDHRGTTDAPEAT